VGDAGGEEAEAGEPFERTSACRARGPAREFPVGRVQARGHVVESGREFLKFVLRIQLDRLREFATGDAVDAEFAGRGSGGRPAVEETEEAGP